jgi:hypothetical protein
MAHDYHDALPGYSQEQLLHDGCIECEYRAQSSGLGISQLDKPNFYHAWKRAAEWNRNHVSDVSKAEAPMLNALWAIQLQLERRGIPIGEVPHGV